MKRLVIRQGERTLKHDVTDAPIVIGRDRACDLYFSDKRLSRRHARITATATGARFEDLGSRNGSFVGSKRVQTVEMKPGDVVRLGGLVIELEEDAPKPPPPPEPGEDETVLLDRDAVVAAPAGAGEEKTVILSTETPKPVASEKTVLLERPPEKRADAKTAILDVHALGGASRGPSDTLILEREAPKPPAPTPPPSPPRAAPETVPAETWASSLPWTAKYLAVVAGVAFLVYFILAFPLVRTLSNALTEESLRRGRALLSFAAAANGDAVGEGRLRDVSVAAVLREERVKDALVLDLEGNVLAPGSRADETLTGIEGIDAPLGDIRTFYLGRRGSDYVMVEPLLHRGRRVGLAVVVYEAATASASWAMAVLVLAFLTLLLGVGAAVVVGKRMTLVPLGNLRDDVEAVVKGDAVTLPERQGFDELSEIARSVNRLIARLEVPDVAPVRPPAAAPRTPESGTPVGNEETPGAEPRRPEAAGRAAEGPSPEAGPEGARFWIDENFIVTRVEEGAAAVIGVAASAMEGRHLIEAVPDQKLLTGILDAVNALEDSPESTARAEGPPGGAVEVRASRDPSGAGAVVSLSEPS